MRTAILIDGSFFLKRYQRLRGTKSPTDAARDLYSMCLRHLSNKRERNQLYRIFYYDCPPLTMKGHNPVTQAAVDFGRTPLALWRLEFLKELKRQRKVAVRLGYLNARSEFWALRTGQLKLLLSAKKSLKDLTGDDVKITAQQKGVDMRLGIDIASLAFKKQVDQIVLVAGDSDFVPAAKLARREGIDFILDPMWSTIRPDLHEHIDGLRSVISRRPSKPKPRIGAFDEAQW